MTASGVQVTTSISPVPFTTSPDSGSGLMIENLINDLDEHKGVMLMSSYEFPGRYARWTLAFKDPPLEIVGKGLNCVLRALNERGVILLEAMGEAVDSCEDVESTKRIERDGKLAEINVTVKGRPKDGTFSEEERSRLPSLFSVIRSIVAFFNFKSLDGQLGLYGAFGYDLAFQFEPIDFKLDRDEDSQRDLLLYLPDEILVVDQDKRDSWNIKYDFNYNGKSTSNLPRVGGGVPFKPCPNPNDVERRDTPPGEFANSVDLAKREFACGNLFEAVISQTFREPLNAETPPSTLFRRLRKRNPSPYGFLINLGEDEYLVGASPEMFVRVEEVDNKELGRVALRVETCPISGTVKRGEDALEDSKNIQAILSNAKEESELTMCTDVDRNDKSRMCEAGSVKVIGRRQIEMYSRLIHTVDHVEGYLRKSYDALDAFLGHTWSVTVCGSPKAWATQFVEDTEKSSRAWYGGAVGLVGFDGSLNTGLTLRTVRVHKGVAEIRAGATLLYDSNPIAEEQETELKASAMLDAVVNPGESGDPNAADGAGREPKAMAGKGKNIVIIDHQDSFVHTLSNYFRQTGAEVVTRRSGKETLNLMREAATNGEKPDLVVLSPGPGNPTDFNLKETMATLESLSIPAFGVCLGLQGMVEYFGGELAVLGYPMHGKPSSVTLCGTASSSCTNIFDGLPTSFDVARYHSLHGKTSKMPSCLEVTAKTEDGIAMAIRHKELPYAAVQFHPESILTAPKHGLRIVENVVKLLGKS